MPIAIKFNYIEDNKLKSMVCYYDLYFKAFSAGKAKIYALKLIRELQSKSKPEVQKFIDYKVNTESFYKTEFINSGSLDSSISMPLLKDFFNYLDTLDYDTVMDVSSYVVTKRFNKDSSIVKIDSSLDLNTFVYYPAFIKDSASLLASIEYIDSVIDNLNKIKRYEVLLNHVKELKQWINKREFCFLFKSNKGLRDCVIDTKWSYRPHYDKWLVLIDNVNIEIWKLFNHPPDI